MTDIEQQNLDDSFFHLPIDKAKWLFVRLFRKVSLTHSYFLGVPLTYQSFSQVKELKDLANQHGLEKVIEEIERLALNLGLIISSKRFPPDFTQEKYFTLKRQFNNKHKENL